MQAYKITPTNRKTGLSPGDAYLILPYPARADAKRELDLKHDIGGMFCVLYFDCDIDLAGPMNGVSLSPQTGSMRNWSYCPQSRWEANAEDPDFVPATESELKATLGIGCSPQYADVIAEALVEAGQAGNQDLFNVMLAAATHENKAGLLVALHDFLRS